ncbi:MAG: helix-turn-helix transcriptional regulator [Candidatus Sericytochromatia bacterium]|nr:helix-turn-helix transcriptional regulator [Candidatus Sericytochromatia bacterium]
MKLLREFLTRRRNELNLSQQELARISGVPAGTIASIEAGRVTRSPRPDTLRRLADGLQVGPEALLRMSGYLPSDRDSAHLLDLSPLGPQARERMVTLYNELVGVLQR